MSGASARVRQSSRAITLTGLLLSAGLAAGQGFECAALKPSSSQQPPYGRIPGQARCEGYFEQSVSQPFVELVSLTRGVPLLEAATRPTLRAARRLATRLLIQPLTASPFYRVDAQLEAGQALLWDAAPMLGATGLRPQELGFVALARAGPDEVPAVVPVSVAAEHDASSVGFAMLRASVSLSSIAWRAYRGAAAAPAGAWRTRAAPPPYAWQPAAIPIDLPADGAGLRVDVRAVDTQGQPLPLLSFVVVGLEP